MSCSRICVAFVAATLTLLATRGRAAETWRYLVVAPEHGCAPYNRDDYPYPHSVEREITSCMGGRIYRPYTGTHSTSRRQTDIEHMVATSEAHGSGLCVARFAGDFDNLTLASPRVDRYEKRAKDGHLAPRSRKERRGSTRVGVVGSRHSLD